MGQLIGLEAPIQIPVQRIEGIASESESESVDNDDIDDAVQGVYIL